MSKQLHCGLCVSCFQHKLQQHQLVPHFLIWSMLCSPQSPSWAPRVKGEWAHRWGLTKARDMLYNTHDKRTLGCAAHLQCRGPQNRLLKSTYYDIVCKQMSKMIVNTGAHIHRQQRVQEDRSAWRVHCIHSEGQAGKDRWCTSDCKGQETLRCSPECCYLSRKTNWPRTTDVVNPKLKCLKSWRNYIYMYKNNPEKNRM